MPERGHFIEERAFVPRPASGEFRITPKESSRRVKTFTESKELSFLARLDFLNKEFPQTRGTSWQIEGGTATAIYVPDKNRPIRDIDILTSSKSMADEFIDALPYFHARWVNDWLEQRRWRVTQDKINYIFQKSVRMPIGEDRIAMLMAPTVLAASKIRLYRGKPPRPQDRLDVQYLGISEAKIQAVLQRLAA